MAQDLKKRRTLRDCNIPTKATLTLSLRLRGHQLKVYIITPDGEPNIRLLVEHSDTIGFVKKKIAEMQGIPSNEQRLVCHHQEMKDHKTLKDYQIRYGSTDIQLGARIHLMVLLADGKTCPLDMDPRDRVKYVKAEIFNKTGIPMSQQNLVFDKTIVLHDEMTLLDGVIFSGTNVRLVD